METREISKIIFLNNSEAILEYLVKRTDDTIGTQVDRADAIIVGHVEKDESKHSPVRTEHLARLKPWLSGDETANRTIFVQMTKVQAETWLTFPVGDSQIDIAYAYPVAAFPGGRDIVPVFHLEDRGLLFLKKIATDVPYKPYIPDPAYHLAEGELGVRNFLVTDYDENGSSFVRDETSGIEEIIAAVKWYIPLSGQKPEILYGSLLKALDNPNPRISNHAIRALARHKEPDIVRAFKERLSSGNQDFRVRLMLGFWILGEKDTATNLLKGFYQKQDDFAWLETWDIKPTMVRGCSIVETLYGPDPSEVKGD